MKKILVPVVAFIILAIPLASQAATEAEKRTAIEDGLAFLATTQNLNGSFGSGGTDYLLANTGSTLLAFLEEKDNWVVDYQPVVDAGINFILTNAAVVTIGMQPAGDPDGDGNGIGVKLYPGGLNSRDTYVTGICLAPIARTGTPDKLVTVGPLASRTDGSGLGGAWTYRDVVQNVIDYFAFGQYDAVNSYQGGWRYYANYSSSDQSTTQWPVISGFYASLMGVSYPKFVKDELAIWVNTIQRGDGAGQYVPGSAYGEMNETGALLIMQAFLGWPLSDSRVQDALNYINIHWQETASGWDGNFGHPYAMWAIYKGLELTIGLDNESVISNLHLDPGDVDNPDHDYNWWEDYCEFLVNAQLANGSWIGYSNWPSGLATPWYINILAATSIPELGTVPFDIKPGSCPNPINTKSKGVLPAAIMGTENLDVTQIDPDTLRLRVKGTEEPLVAPLRWAYADVGEPFEPYIGKQDCFEDCLGCTCADGYNDLVFHFETQEVIAALGEVYDGDCLVLEIIGNLKEEDGGTPFLGEDVVRILKKGK